MVVPDFEESIQKAVKEIEKAVVIAAKNAADALAVMLNNELKQAVNGLPVGPSYRSIREDAAHIEFRSRVAPASGVGGAEESVVIEPVATGPLSSPMDQVLGALEYGSNARQTPASRFFSHVLAEVNAKLQESIKEVLAEKYQR